jgi:hypothetical protein
MNGGPGLCVQAGRNPARTSGAPRLVTACRVAQVRPTEYAERLPTWRGSWASAGMSAAVREGARVALLGMPARIPVAGHVYRMPPEFYDPTDIDWHPVLVVSLDQVVREAHVVTRTTSEHAKGPKAVIHAPQPGLRLDRQGWWRVHRIMPVAYMLFGDPEVQHLGRLEDGTWARIVSVIEGAGR